MITYDIEFNELIIVIDMILDNLFTVWKKPIRATRRGGGDDKNAKN